jgi:uncharacterized protein with HEPN domain
MKGEAVDLRHILECIRRIEGNVAGGKEAFMASHTLQDAVLRNLQTMTESTQRLSEGLKAAHPEVEWRVIAAFRNVLAHDYLGIDLDRIWEVSQRDIPSLKRALTMMVERLG